MKPIIITKRWWMPLPVPGFAAITIYPFIIIRDRMPKSTLRHELIHYWQVRVEGWWHFYLGYLWAATHTKYRNLPSEIIAYKYESDPKYLPPELEALVEADV